MIRVERATNPKDRTCDQCDEKLADEHVRLTNTAGPGASRVTDLCDRCAIFVGVVLIQTSGTSPDLEAHPK